MDAEEGGRRAPRAMLEQIPFILILVAILIAFLLLFLRTARFEGHLKEIQGLRQLNERVRRMNELLEGMDSSPLEARLLDLCHKAARMVELLERQEARPEKQGQDREARVSEGREGADVRSLVETVLYGMGYGKVRVLGAPMEVGASELVEIPVECVKADMVHKGIVSVQAGNVVECRIRPAYEVFP